MGFLTNLCCRESPAVVDTTCADWLGCFRVARDLKIAPLLLFAHVSGSFVRSGIGGSLCQPRLDLCCIVTAPHRNQKSFMCFFGLRHFCKGAQSKHVRFDILNRNQKSFMCFFGLRHFCKGAQSKHVRFDILKCFH